jgi:hypothetical protein
VLHSLDDCCLVEGNIVVFCGNGFWCLGAPRTAPPCPPVGSLHIHSGVVIELEEERLTLFGRAKLPSGNKSMPAAWRGEMRSFFFRDFHSSCSGSVELEVFSV